MNGRKGQYAAIGDTVSSFDKKVEAYNFTLDQKLEFIDTAIAYLEAHNLIKDVLLDIESGDACMEGCFAAIITEFDSDEDKALAEEDPDGWALGHMMGITSSRGEVLANFMVHQLRDFMTYFGYIDDGERTSIAVFNDDPNTTKADAIAMFQDFRTQLLSEVPSEESS
jgi:hypothetical protein